MDLVQDRLDAVAKAAREDGWRDAEAQISRPDSYWMRGHLEPAGKREPTEEEAAELERHQEAIATHESENEEDERYNDEELPELERKNQAHPPDTQHFTTTKRRKTGDERTRG